MTFPTDNTNVLAQTQASLPKGRGVESYILYLQGSNRWNLDLAPLVNSQIFYHKSALTALVTRQQSEYIAAEAIVILLRHVTLTVLSANFPEDGLLGLWGLIVCGTNPD